MADKAEKMRSFVSLTCSTDEEAKHWLEAAHWDLDRAVGIYFESGGDSSAAKRLHADDNAFGAHVASSLNGDEVRAPDPSKRQKLIDDTPFMPAAAYGILQAANRYMRPPPAYVPGYMDASGVAMNSYGHHANSGGGNLHSMHDRRSSSRGGGNGGRGSSRGGGGSGAGGGRNPTDLHSLYRPPVDILYRGDFQQAREEGKLRSRWVLVNVQDETEFLSHTLNLDLWSDATVKDVIRENFVFVQMDCKSEGGRWVLEKYGQSLRRSDNSTSSSTTSTSSSFGSGNSGSGGGGGGGASLKLPVVFIVDPRTGRLVFQKTSFKRLEAVDFINTLIDFCDKNQHHLAPPPAPAPKHKGDTPTTTTTTATAATATTAPSARDEVVVEDGSTLTPPLLHGSKHGDTNTNTANRTTTTTTNIGAYSGGSGSGRGLGLGGEDDEDPLLRQAIEASLADLKQHKSQEGGRSSGGSSGGGSSGSGSGSGGGGVVKGVDKDVHVDLSEVASASSFSDGVEYIDPQSTTTNTTSRIDISSSSGSGSGSGSGRIRGNEKDKDMKDSSSSSNNNNNNNNKKKKKKKEKKKEEEEEEREKEKREERGTAAVVDLVDNDNDNENDHDHDNETGSLLPVKSTTIAATTTTTTTTTTAAAASAGNEKENKHDHHQHHHHQQQQGEGMGKGKGANHSHSSSPSNSSNSGDSAGSVGDCVVCSKWAIKCKRRPPLRDETKEGEEDYCRVRFRLITPDNPPLSRTVIRGFNKSDKVLDLYQLVLDEVPSATGRNFDLKLSYPPKSLSDFVEQGRTIEEANLQNAAVLMVWIDE